MRIFWIYFSCGFLFFDLKSFNVTDSLLLVRSHRRTFSSWFFIWNFPLLLSFFLSILPLHRNVLYTVCFLFVYFNLNLHIDYTQLTVEDYIFAINVWMGNFVRWNKSVNKSENIFATSKIHSITWWWLCMCECVYV